MQHVADTVLHFKCLFKRLGADLEAELLPLLLLSVPSDVVFEEQTLPRDVRRVLPVLVVVQLLPRFAPRLRLRVVRRLLYESSDQTNQMAAGTVFNPSPRSCYPCA